MRKQGSRGAVSERGVQAFGPHWTRLPVPPWGGGVLLLLGGGVHPHIQVGKATGGVCPPCPHGAGAGPGRVLVWGPRQGRQRVGRLCPAATAQPAWGPFATTVPTWKPGDGSGPLTLDRRLSVCRREQECGCVASSISLSLSVTHTHTHTHTIREGVTRAADRTTGTTL